MKEFLVKEVKSNCFFTKTLYLDNAFIITTPEMLFTDEIIQVLGKWSFESVFSEGEPSSEYISNESAGETLDNGDTAPSQESDSNTPSGSLFRVSISQQPDSDKLEKAETFYVSFLSFVENTFVKASVSNELDYKVVTKKIMDMAEYIKEDRRFLMRIIKNIEPAPEKNYLATHSVRSTILSIIIGTYLKLPNPRLIELGVAALLHEMGMLKLPSQTYLNQRALSAQEQKAIPTLYLVTACLSLLTFRPPFALRPLNIMNGKTVPAIHGG